MYRPIILRGDYVGNAPNSHARQQMALTEGCVLVVDFHFNSATPAAKGGEVHYKTAGNASKELARLMWEAFAQIGLPPHGQSPPLHAAAGERSGFIERYAMTTVLLEPLFVSNFDQARWLHTPANFDALAGAVVRAIKAHANGGTIGLSPGHAYKTSAPNDTGAACAGGGGAHDHERQHSLELADRVAQLLA